MLMKGFNKGQIVIPVGIRNELGIEVGDSMDVEIDPEGLLTIFHPGYQKISRGNDLDTFVTYMFKQMVISSDNKVCISCHSTP
jgi:AbrB family looped-hinge helix DNA binding protein